MSDTDLSKLLSELEGQYMHSDPVLGTLNNFSDIENQYIPQFSLHNIQGTPEQSATWTDHEKRRLTEMIEEQGRLIEKVSTCHIQVIKTRLHAITVNQSRTAQLRSLTHNLEVRLNHLTLQASNLRQASIRGHNSRRQGRWELVVPALENRIAVLERSIEELGGELRKKVQECVTDIGGRGMAPQADMFGLKRDRQEQIENDEEDDILAVGRPRKRLRHE